jgi:uncharacterized membrane protein YraQ (UPF0718 family)
LASSWQTLLGLPFYADIFGTIPIAEALLSKGRSWDGFGLYDVGHHPFHPVFGECCGKAIKPKLLAMFVAICLLGIILVGYLFNALQP